MNFYDAVIDFLGDDRLLANLLALHVFLGFLLLASFAVRKLVIHGGDHLARWTGVAWLEGVGKEAARRVRSLLFWSTVSALSVAFICGVIYHFGGRDVRLDLGDLYGQLTARHLLKVAWALGQLVFLTVALVFTLRLIKRGRQELEEQALKALAEPATADAPAGDALAAAISPGTEPKVDPTLTIRRWFYLLERFALITVFLTALWLAGHIVHLNRVVDTVVLFAIRVLAILMVARLLTLASRTLSQNLANLGNRHLSSGKFQRYWERVTRLFPFGERCFEAAVYISAASLLIRELEFISVIADLGPRVVQCIGIFFISRVLIELLSVLLNEAFGVYADDRAIDQKTQTLLPLLHSVCQYALYFGCGVIMLGVLGVDTTPILAGAGILGLAGGLGAQSLVTDVVSGFFILFENQYLVGDHVKIGDAEGRVEAVSIRHTQIRDEQGKLHIVPNGQIKSVINYSKGFVNAVVDIKAPTSTSLEQVTRDMSEAGRRLRLSHREVLSETAIQGLVELTPGEMTVRAITRVRPGTHREMQNEFRRQLKTVFDERRTADDEKSLAA